jgi:hypothetical protein
MSEENVPYRTGEEPDVSINISIEPNNPAMSKKLTQFMETNGEELQRFSKKLVNFLTSEKS